MHRDEIRAEVRAAFAGAPRPQLFIRGTCQCEECLAHEAELQSFSPNHLPVEKLGNPGWDPICFASNPAFTYLMPGLVKLVLEHPNDYLQQFLFHVAQPERLDSFTASQARTLIKVLAILVLEETAAVDTQLATDELFRAKNALEHCSAVQPTPPERFDGVTL